MSAAILLQEKVELLQDQLEQRDQSIKQKDKLIEKRDALISVLEEKLRLLDMARFAAKSEKAAIDQLGLFDEAELLTSVEAEEDAADTTSVKSHQRSSKPRVSIPQDLPREEIVYDVAEADKQCL